jgi:antitoxin MazE
MEAPMHSKVQRWGNSLAVRIPRIFAKDVGIEEDSLVEISVTGGELVISPRAPLPLTLEQLLEGITDENLHEEIATGPALGNEAW